MANKSIICQHPLKLKIDEDIISGMPASQVAKKYNLSSTTVQRYIKEKIPEQLSAASLSTAEGLVARINEYLSKVDKLFQDTTEWLNDPSDPGRFTIAPRANEINVIYTVMELNSKGNPTYKKKTKQLDQLLADCGVSHMTEGVKYTGTDPRVLLLKTAEVLNKQLELLAKMQGNIVDRVEVKTVTGDATDIIKLARQALKPWPGAADALADALTPATLPFDGEDEEE